MVTAELADGIYPFRTESYALAELAMTVAPPELAALLMGQAERNGNPLIRDEVVEIVCRGEGLDDHRFVIFWPSDDVLHILTPKRYVVGRA